MVRFPDCRPHNGSSVIGCLRILSAVASEGLFYNQADRDLAPMKPFVIAVLAGFVLLIFRGTPPLWAKSNDPCQSAISNAAMRECYYREQMRVNAEADSLAAKFAAGLRSDAQNPRNGPVTNELLERAAAGIAQSQRTWKEYRDQYCMAIEYSWTTGSGAGTANEACLFNLGRQRVRELHSAFDDLGPSNAQRR